MIKINFWKKVVLCFLCLGMLFAVVSCNSGNEDPVVLKCNGIEIKESIYKMYLYEAGAALKEEHVPSYTDEEYAALSQEELEAYYALLDRFWKTEIDGKMPFEIVKEQALENLKIYAFYAKECKNNNVAMTEEELRSFTSQMELYYADSLDSIEDLFGVTSDEYISYLAEMDVFASYVDIKASGISVKEEEIAAKFAENREKYGKITVQTIFLKVTEEKDSDTQKALAETLKERIENGEEIGDLVLEYSDYKVYDDGSMLVTKDSEFDKHMGKGYVKYVLESEKNDIAIIETNLGYCLVKTVDVKMVDEASIELKVMIQDEKYINQVKSIVEGNEKYAITVVNEDLYNAIVEVPEILK